MKNLKIATKLGLLIGILSALLVLIGGIGLYGMQKSDDALDSIYNERVVPLTLLADIKYVMLHNRMLIANSLIVQTPEAVAKNETVINADIEKISKL